MANNNIHNKQAEDWQTKGNAHKALALAKEYEKHLQNLVAQGKAVIERTEISQGYKIKYRILNAND